MRKLMAVAIGMLALTGCTSDDSESQERPAPPVTTSASGPTTFVDEGQNHPPITEGEEEASGSGGTEGGPGEVGETYTAQVTSYGADEPSTYTFSVNAITPNFPCDNSGIDDEPINGLFVAVEMTATTTALSPSEALDISAHDFEVLGEGNKIENDPATLPAAVCTPDGQGFPIAGLGANRSADFVVVLDTQFESGTIVFEGREFSY